MGDCSRGDGASGAYACKAACNNRRTYFTKRPVSGVYYRVGLKFGDIACKEYK
ncbi:hypothetical protein RvY_09133 [Ramazzottius varieornatus]|uniref:Uncharacterized protein n=1 Tax=Ramazzottius varieornatus TaxID=947166 RepID=A0A1D1V891_RAMVA|nr:hypothetical protein RvY_09133 [Ramazzottius varieornatus]